MEYGIIHWSFNDGIRLHFVVSIVSIQNVCFLSKHLVHIHNSLCMGYTVHIRSLQFRFCMRNHIPTIHYNHQSKSHTCSHTVLFHSNSCDSLPFHSLGTTSATILLSDPSVFDYESGVLSKVMSCINELDR